MEENRENKEENTCKVKKKIQQVGYNLTESVSGGNFQSF